MGATLYGPGMGMRVLQHKPAVDLRAALRTVRIYVGLGQLALHLLGIS